MILAFDSEQQLAPAKTPESNQQIKFDQIVKPSPGNSNIDMEDFGQCIISSRNQSVSPTPPIHAPRTPHSNLPAPSYSMAEIPTPLLSLDSESSESELEIDTQHLLYSSLAPQTPSTTPIKSTHSTSPRPNSYTPIQSCMKKGTKTKEKADLTPKESSPTFLPRTAYSILRNSNELDQLTGAKIKRKQGEFVDSSKDLHEAENLDSTKDLSHVPKKKKKKKLNDIDDIFGDLG